MSEPVITIQDLYFRYRGRPEPAVDGISFEVEAGDFLVIMGHSEAGKSTLAASMNGLVPHFHRGKFTGDVIVMGRNTRDHTVAQMSELLGMVFQDFEAQLFSTNVELEVAFGPENFAVPREEIARRIDENLKLVGLEALRERSPSTLSGGQKQKLAIASVLAMQTPILVMDEPTTDLDPISKEGVFEIAKELRERGDLTLIVVEHETEEALHADHLLLLKEGQILKMGPAAEMLREVDLLQETGVMPLGVPLFFKRMGASYLPLTLEEGQRHFAENGWRISERRHAELLAADAARQAARGPILIHCEGLEHTYPGGVEALKGVDLDIHQGEMIGIVGQNGSGKTTLVKHFNGLLMPTGGEIEVEGVPTVEQGVFNLGQKVGYVFQNPDHQIFSETVFDEVAYSLRLREMDEEVVEARVAEALEAVGLSGMEDADPFSMTKSGRQRVAVASVLAIHPDVLILDEPTTGLDYREQRSMMELVRKMNERGSTIIFVTHHMWVVAEYADRVFVVKDGRILLEGTTRQVFAQEEVLREAHLRPPQLVSLSNRLGKTLLGVDEFVQCTVAEDA
ncbi:MAG: ABC transporter ATP-binding protein [Anaerolineae bacterium]